MVSVTAFILLSAAMTLAQQRGSGLANKVPDPEATHSFVYFQELGANQNALKDAWPRTISFLKKNLK